MDYPGVTTYEPTLFHLLLFLLIITLLTYPLSFILISVGVIKPANRGNNILERIFYRVNEILKKQIKIFFIAWLGGAFLCSIIFFAWIFISGFLVFLKIIEPVNNVLSKPILLLMGLIHIIIQAIGYRFAIKESSWIE